MAKLLFIDHAFHAHTRSADFIKNLLAEEYAVDLVYLDPENVYTANAFGAVLQKHYDCVVIWQLMPSLTWLKQFVSWDKIAFFPMYDGILPLSSSTWQEYKSVKIISFSKTLQKALKSRGFDAKYIQYFPKPQAVEKWGDPDSVFYWQRVHNMPIQAIIDTLNGYISKIHIHASLDPHHAAVNIITDKPLTRSTWFETKEEMYQKILESGLYIAPRLSEGIGMSFLEAMAMGRCVIAVNQPTMNEYIQNGKTGFLFRTDNRIRLDIKNVREIQKNTLAYIERGYKSWDKGKRQILKWIKMPVRSRQFNSQLKFSLFGKIPLFYWRKT